MKTTLRPPRRVMVTAVASAMCMGAGQIMNRQIIKGILYITAFLFSVLYAIPYCMYCIEDLISLGTIPGKEHSLFLIVHGLLAIVILGYFLFLYVGNIRDAYRTAAARAAGEEAPGFVAGLKAFLSRRKALIIVSPGVVVVILVVILPLVFSILIGFTSYDSFNQPPGKLLSWVGIKNFVSIFTIKSWAATFWGVLGWTLCWTVLSSVLPYALGVITAVVMNNPRVKGKRFFKTVFILPYAIPGYIMILVWRSMFDTDFGLINTLLGSIGVEPIQWLHQVGSARFALVLVALWSGFTFPFMLSDGILKSIPSELYEAARLDGASSLLCFRRITLPLLFFSIAPMFIMGLAGAFNNFNLIYLLTEGGPPDIVFQGAGQTDILISWLFKMTFNLHNYKLASAISLIIFIFIGTFSIVSLRRTRSFKEEDMVQ